MTDDSSSSVCLSLSSSSSSSLSSQEKPDAISPWKAILIPVSEHKCCYDSKENDEKDPGVIEYSLCLFFAKLVSLTFLYWLPFYIQTTKIGGEFHGVSSSAEFSAFFDVGGMIGGILAGYISDRTGCSGIVVAVMLFCAGPVLSIYRFLANVTMTANIGLMIITGILVNGPYSLITTAVSANLGSHPCLKGNTKAMAMVTAIIDGTGSMGEAKSHSFNLSNVVRFTSKLNLVFLFPKNVEKIRLKGVHDIKLCGGKGTNKVFPLLQVLPLDLF
ncbi:putative glycerol-3-phosphate transporter 1 [Stylophora pistillata]|uniref:putative glycerol-3-phosphate transporter 1 n=1 Tax=Stylophora pistillata TaxID=50429 RepID=UPI000C03FA1E|nr:putative glycerol-3-phosphate transporter 1 [Stylophora pistillata]